MFLKSTVRLRLFAQPVSLFSLRLSRIHFSSTEKCMRDKRTPTDVCGEAISSLVLN